MMIDDLVGRSEWNTGQANVFGDDLEPATANDEMGDNF
jgi:hypothetical protein